LEVELKILKSNESMKTLTLTFALLLAAVSSNSSPVITILDSSEDLSKKGIEIRVPASARRPNVPDTAIVFEAPKLITIIWTPQQSLEKRADLHMNVRIYPEAPENEHTLAFLSWATPVDESGVAKTEFYYDPAASPKVEVGFGNSDFSLRLNLTTYLRKRLEPAP